MKRYLNLKMFSSKVVASVLAASVLLSNVGAMKSAQKPGSSSTIEISDFEGFDFVREASQCLHNADRVNQIKAKVENLINSLDDVTDDESLDEETVKTAEELLKETKGNWYKASVVFLLAANVLSDPDYKSEWSSAIIKPRYSRYLQAADNIVSWREGQLDAFYNKIKKLKDSHTDVFLKTFVYNKSNFKSLMNKTLCVAMQFEDVAYILHDISK